MQQFVKHGTDYQNLHDAGEEVTALYNDYQHWITGPGIECGDEFEHNE